MKNKVIGVVANSSTPGLLNFRRDFLINLVKDGHTVYVFSPTYSSTEYLELNRIGVRCLQLSLSRKNINPLNELLVFFRFVKSIKSLKLDCIYGFFLKPSIYSVFGGFLAGVPRKVAMLEGLGSLFTNRNNLLTFKTLLFRLIVSRTIGFFLSFSDLVILLNPDDKREVSNWFFTRQPKLEVFGPIGCYIPTTITPWINRKDDGVRTIVFIGRLLWDKGISEFVEAASIVSRRSNSFKFLLVGDIDNGNPKSLTSNELSEIQNKPFIQHVGYSSDVNQILSKASLLILPSYREGFPKVIQEAFSWGVPVIGADVPGTRSAINDRMNGMLVKPFDNVALSNAILTLLSDPLIMQKMSISARRTAVNKFQAEERAIALCNLILNDD